MRLKRHRSWPSRLDLGREERQLLKGGALGAALMLVFTRGVVRHTARRVAFAAGYAARLAHLPRGERSDLDDATIAHKIETVLFRPADVPKGQILVNVQDGVAQLRGEVPRPEMIDELVRKAKSVAGVRDVENLLHLPNTPAPMHQ